MKLKVYGATIMIPSIAVRVSLSEPSHHRQCRAYVAATSQKKAAEVLGLSLYDFRMHGARLRPDRDDALQRACLAVPEQMFLTPLDRSLPIVLKLESTTALIVAAPERRSGRDEETTCTHPKPKLVALGGGRFRCRACRTVITPTHPERL